VAEILDEKLETIGKMIDLGQVEEAISQYAVIIQEEGSSPRLRALLGYAYFRAGKFFNAEQEFSKALVDTPGAANTLFMRGRSRQEIADLEGALADFIGVTKIDATAADAYTEAASIMHYRGNLDDALKWYQKAISLNPDDKIAAVGLAELSS
jgi:tetratricopeptide (TPR) repeat protein